MAAAAALIDPTIAGNYPVILGEGLLGKTSNDIFTSVRYNHKPALSSRDGPAGSRLKPSKPGDTSSYDLAFSDDAGSYGYTGSRTVTKNQYVLHFDATRKAFILDRIDSTFNLNLTRLPKLSDPKELSRRYPHLKGPSSPAVFAKPSVPSRLGALQAKPPPPIHRPDPVPVPKKVQPTSTSPLKHSVTLADKDEDEEDDDDDDDGGLLVEYPGADASAVKHAGFSPSFPPRRFDDFMNRRDSAGDADGENDGKPRSALKQPVSVGRQAPRPELDAGKDDEEEVEEEEEEEEEAVEEEKEQRPPVPAMEEGLSAEELEDELEKEMEMAFDHLENSQGESPPVDDESEISEED